MCVVPALFCACTRTKNFCYAREDEKDSSYEKGLLAGHRLLNVLKFQQNETDTEDHLFDPS